MHKKLPKLQACKDAGVRTILVLENGDMALSNHWAIYEAAKAALAGRADRPDEVWLVDTTIPKEWTAWCLIRDGKASRTTRPPTAIGTSTRSSLKPSGRRKAISLYREARLPALERKQGPTTTGG
jgi:hypothetical protein